MPEMGKNILLFRGMPKCEEFEVLVLILEIEKKPRIYNLNNNIDDDKDYDLMIM